MVRTQAPILSDGDFYLKRLNGPMSQQKRVYLVNAQAHTALCGHRPDADVIPSCVLVTLSNCQNWSGSSVPRTSRSAERRIRGPRAPVQLLKANAHGHMVLDLLYMHTQAHNPHALIISSGWCARANPEEPESLNITAVTQSVLDQSDPVWMRARTAVKSSTCFDLFMHSFISQRFVAVLIAVVHLGL